MHQKGSNDVLNTMEKNLHKILSDCACCPETDLPDHIWHAVVIENKHQTRIKLWIFSLVGVGSLAAIIPALNTLITRFSESGFYDYFSLIFSDIGSVATAWKEFGLLLTESLPVMSITITLALVLIFFISIRYTVKQIIINNQLSF